MKFAHIIVGVDFSVYSRNAAKQAKILASAWKAKLTFVHVYDDRTLIAESTATSESFQDIWEHFKDRVEETYNKGGKARVIVKSGRPDLEILRIAKKSRGSLIIVGHKGKGAIERVFLGSVAEKLSLTSKAPVWIHVSSVAKLPKKVLIPVDIMNLDHAPQKAFKLDFVKKAKSEFLYVLPMVSPYLDYNNWAAAQEALTKATDKQLLQFKRRYPKKKVREAKGDPAMKVLGASRKYDLIVMAPHSRRPLFPALGKVTTRVLRRTSKPVLIVP